MKKLFFDMDGTLFEWRNLPEEEMYQLETRNYFENIGVHKDLKNLVFKLRYSNKYEMYVCSNAWSRQAVDGKNGALNREFPGVFPMAKRIFVPRGIKKSEVCLEKIGTLKDCYLFDDHTPNLHDWAEHGGNAIKVLNGINNNGSSSKPWRGVKMTLDGRILMPDPPEKRLLENYDALIEALYVDAAKTVMGSADEEEKRNEIKFLKSDPYGIGTARLLKMLGIA